MSEILFGPIPNEEAAQFIADKPAVSRAVFDRLLPEIKARTFLVSGLVPLDIAQKLRDRIVDLPLGGDWDAIKRDLVGELSPFLRSTSPAESTPEEDEAAAAAAERKAELLLRTHGYQAYSAAQYEVMDRQRDVFPYWRYQTAQDDRVRDSHAALEGVVIPANDPFWQTHFPPWDFNCRCSVVPLSEADVAEIRAEDEKKPADERSILSADVLARMNTSGTLQRGPSVNVDVRSPRQKRDSSGYSWQPGELRIPLATLRERYSPEVWDAFERFAKATPLEGEGRTVWEWLEEKPATVPPAPVPPVAAAPAPAADPERPRRAPVSAAFNLRGARTVARPVFERTLAMVDRVHDDGQLPTMKLTARPTRGALGHFRAAAREIAVDPKGAWPQMTAAHELGHMIDMFALGEGGGFGSENSAAFDAWRRAVLASKPVQILQTGMFDNKPIYGVSYYLRPRELWARSYAQYIAQKSGSAEMLQQLNSSRHLVPFIQWSDEDFAPIAAAIDDLFKQKGWLA